MIRTAVLTISDSCASGQRQDLSGRAIMDILPGDKFEICRRNIVPDDHQRIVEALKTCSDKEEIDIVLTTGGTGLGPRDVTPEATASVCQRIVPGVSEILRAEGYKKTHHAVLGRGMAGIRNNTLIINLPGSPKAVRESLEILLDVLPHAVEMMRGGGH